MTRLAIALIAAVFLTDGNAASAADTGAPHLSVPNNDAPAGLNGAGQTIVVIDSGLAYDHPSFAGRYVGGWDFAEQDDDPYDDQTTQARRGGHGTLVAGVAAASGTGLATGADIVSLRVFDDSGKTYFTRVEQALQWVVEHHADMANPITTVNISLGTDWNSSEPPNWGSYEDEFQTLAEANIFVTASAGNDFVQFGTQGLTYPAASPLITAAMALTGSGQLASYSQRHIRALGAPGTNLSGPAPDYLGNKDGIANDFRSSSGTSLAAPYLAGASMLVRQAFEISGQTEVSPQTIYDHLRNTADWVYDETTQENYAAINLNEAINTILDPIEGDFNFDGAVDAADYTLWRDGLGSSYNSGDYGKWKSNFTNAAVSLPGDFNFDGRVDAADYTVWRDGLGSSYSQTDYNLWKNNFGRNANGNGSALLPGDFNFDGHVDAADYTVWRDGLGSSYSPADYNLWKANFGRSGASSEILAIGYVTAVPEPASLVLILLLSLSFFAQRRDSFRSF